LILISVVIATKDNATVIGEQLEALAAQLPEHGCEVIVVDNGSTDGTASVVTSFEGRLPALRVVRADERAGAGFARNFGAGIATGDYLFFIDADDRVAPGWYDAMVASSAEHSAIGGNIAWFQIIDGREVETKGAYDHHPDHGFDFLPSISGGNCGMDAALFHDLGGWNEAYAAGGEDVELYWRAHLAGHPAGFVADGVLHVRTRAGDRAVLRQSYRDGSAHPHLYRDFAAAGMPRSSFRSAARAWLRLLKRAPGAVYDHGRRRPYLVDLGQRSGRIAGSIRFRTTYF
jgi:glycosyltransferase involved in cell wall biosynthesis